MSQTTNCVQAAYSDIRSQWAVTRRNRKITAINGRSSFPLQPNPIEYNTTPSSRRRKRSASNESEEGDSRDGEEHEDGEVGASKDNEEGAGNDASSSTARISFEKVLARGSVHTAECCRLVMLKSLPRAFCERYNVESHVTMTDSTGDRLWHMRFQSCGIYKLSRPSVYTISNGWREFSYDHSLKVNDRVVFTLHSTSHFLVELAASNGSPRVMLPTRDGEVYPWKINWARLDCLSNANDVDSPQVWLQEKEIRRNMAPITAEEDKLQEEYRKRTLVPIILQEDEQGVIRIKTVETITLEAEDVEDLIRKSAAAITLKEDEQKLRPLSESRRERMITSPDKQQLQKEMFCQCDTAKVGKGMDTRSDTSWKEYVLPELTHLECKNADGSSYLQIVDSDSEIT